MTERRISYQQGLTAQFPALERIVTHVSGQLSGPTMSSDACRLRTVAKPVFVGMGASFAALAVPVELLGLHGVYAQRVLASDLTPGMAAPPGDLVMAVSQSGRSMETLAAMQLCDPTVRACIVNVVGSHLSDACHLTIDLGNEPDSYASTVAFSGTIAALELVAGALVGRDASTAWSGAGERLSAFSTAVRPAVDQVVEAATGVVAADVIAEGAHRASAEEGALLLREVCRVPASASTTRNYLHGEMESAGRTLHIVVGSGREVSLAQELARAGHVTLLLTCATVAPEPQLTVVGLPAVDPHHVGEQVVAATVVLQAIAGGLAGARGVDIEEFVFANHDTKAGGITAEGVAAGVAYGDPASPNPVR